MRLRRFFLPDLARTDRLQLTGDERHHAVDVLRLAVGAQVELFDDDGRTAIAEIAAIDAQSVKLTLLGDVSSGSQSRARLHLAVAAPKQKRADFLVEKCAELGVASLRFIETERSIVKLRDHRVDRLQQKATEAAKQSGALPVMRVLPLLSLQSFLDERPADAVCFFGATEIEARPILPWLASQQNAAIAEATCLIGPEGGWSENELTRLSERATPVRFHANTLRIETAAIAVASLWNGFFDGQMPA